MSSICAPLLDPEFPYYKVYFKPLYLSFLSDTIVHFHTIKSILNIKDFDKKLKEYLKFPYYKVYFKPAVERAKAIQEMRFPYYKVYFKQ